MTGLVARFDAGVLGRFERTPTGGVRIPAKVTRSGILLYERADGVTYREYRPDSEVFAPKSLATLRDAAVTIAHPATGSVTPDTFRRDAVGHIGEPGRREGDFVTADVVVQDSSAIDYIENGMLAELSCGYFCRLDATPGTTPSGEAYDSVQRDISYDHVALVPRGGGRAGREVALRIDGAAYCVDAIAVVPPAFDAQAMALRLLHGRPAVGARVDATGADVPPVDLAALGAGRR